MTFLPLHCLFYFEEARLELLCMSFVDLHFFSRIPVILFRRATQLMLSVTFLGHVKVRCVAEVGVIELLQDVLAGTSENLIAEGLL